MKDQVIWNDILKIKTYSPLIHKFTNYVVMNNTTDALLANLIVSGKSITKVLNEHPIKSRVTGMECTSNAITGAFVAAGSDYFRACNNAVTVMGIAGEMASVSNGTVSFQVNFIDSLYNFDLNLIESRIRIQYQ